MRKKLLVLVLAGLVGLGVSQPVLADENTQSTTAVAQNTSVTGLQKASDGNWYYYVNGVVDTSYTGIVKNSTGWWRVENGKINFNFTGLAQNANGWWYLKNGKIDFSYTGIVKNSSGWWRVENGKVNFNFTGLAKNENGWWYLKNGKIDFSYTGIIKTSTGWWRVENGKVNFSFTGLAKNENGWWYLKNGKIDFDYYGFAKKASDWWYVEGGRITFKYDGLVQLNSDFLYCENSRVNFNYTGSFTYDGHTYTIKNGKACFNTQADKDAIAKVIAKEIAEAALSYGTTDREKVYVAAYIVSCYCANDTYTMSGKDYRTAYGVFVKGEYSCAGSTRALGLVLDCMGYSWTHVNENQYTHQWCELYMDGQKGWADGMGGDCGYGEWGQNSVTGRYYMY